MGRTEIDGDQVQDESLTGDDILDGSVLKEDLSSALQAEINANTAKIFGDDSAFDQDDGPFVTTSGTFVTAFTLNLSVGASPDGTYRVGWNTVDITSKSNTLGEVRVVVDAGLPSEIIIKTSTVSFIETRFSGFDSGVIANGARTIDLQVRRAAGNGSVTLTDYSLEAWRVL